jgi:hypothetical protein
MNQRGIAMVGKSGRTGDQVFRSGISEYSNVIFYAQPQKCIMEIHILLLAPKVKILNG